MKHKPWLGATCRVSLILSSQRSKRQIQFPGTDAVAVMDDEPVRLLSRDTFPKLLQRPFSSWMTRRVEMQKPAAADFHDDEHIDKPERCGDHDEEVTRDDRFGMIPHESHPTLGSHSGRLRFSRHIAPDRSRGNLNADL